MAFCVILLWFFVSSMFLCAAVYYGIYYVIRFIGHKLLGWSMPKKKARPNDNYIELVAQSLSKQGYKDMILNPAGKDDGADIIATDPHGNRVCIQCNRYDTSVGPSAVKKAAAAKKQYGCSKAAVITNATFTQEAKELALVDEIELLECYDALFN